MGVGADEDCTCVVVVDVGGIVSGAERPRFANSSGAGCGVGRFVVGVEGGGADDAGVCATGCEVIVDETDCADEDVDDVEVDVVERGMKVSGGSPWKCCQFSRK